MSCIHPCYSKVYHSFLWPGTIEDNERSLDIRTVPAVRTATTEGERACYAAA